MEERLTQVEEKTVFGGKIKRKERREVEETDEGGKWKRMWININETNKTINERI